jgi:hypothetical protein
MSKDFHKLLQLERNSMASYVLDFMLAFDQLPVVDRFPSKEDFQLAKTLIEEEVIKEMLPGLEAYKNGGDPTAFADGAIDAIYVILWSLLKLGMSPDKLFAEVQRSNMAKLHPDGTYRKFPEGHEKAGKVMKPADWTAPDIAAVLEDGGCYAGFHHRAFVGRTK